ncbi:MAG TPA: TetR/AcrR family transcriptional regulator [Acidimicrobiales bacterium]
MTLVIVNGESVANDSRAKMVQSAANLIGSQGLNATSFSDVLASSGAPRGSIYFHFPGGKRELAKDAIRLTSEQILTHIQASSTRSPSEVLNHFVALFRHVVEASDGAAGCAVAGVTVDIPATDDELLVDAREAFHSWVALLAEQLETAGVDHESARDIATIAVASVEGALILCRAERGSAPLDAVARQLKLLVESRN